MKQLVVIAHNLRSAHNVGSLLRTADGLGVNEVILTGYTPHPPIADDTRLPHEQQRVLKQLQKTALGAEQSQPWRFRNDVATVLLELKQQRYTIAALEQAADSVSLSDFTAPEKLAVILGREVEGLEPALLASCDITLEIPMFGKKESFNVVEAASMLLYHWRFVA